METGLYYPLRFFEHRAGEPELSSNRKECEGYMHEEYLHVPTDRLLPFSILIKDAEIDIQEVINSITLKRICLNGDEEEVTISKDEWDIISTEIGYYLTYRATLSIEAQPIGQARLQLEFDTPYTKKYYSDWFVFFKEIEDVDILTHTVTFRVTSGGFPLEGVKIEFDGKVKYTNFWGEAVFEEVHQGFKTWTASKDGYFTKSNTQFINSDEIIDIVLEENLTITFRVTDKETNDRIKGATVLFAGQEKTTNNIGEAYFSDIESGTKPYHIYKLYYKYNEGNVEITETETIEKDLEPMPSNYLIHSDKGGWFIWGDDEDKPIIYKS